MAENPENPAICIRLRREFSRKHRFWRGRNAMAGSQKQSLREGFGHTQRVEKSSEERG